MRGTRTSIRKLVHQHSVRVVALNFRVARSIEAIEELTRKTLFCWLLPITSPEPQRLQVSFDWRWVITVLKASLCTAVNIPGG
jgi:hypothetical protein